MAKKSAPEPAAAPAMTHVYPAPELAERGEYLAGVGIDGAEVSPELAAEWLAAGLVVLSPTTLAGDEPVHMGDGDAETLGDQP